MGLFIQWLISALSLILVDFMLTGVKISDFYIALIAAAIIGLANIFIKPLLIILTLPINILTLGLFIFVINALILWFVSSFVEGFHIDGFGSALMAAVVLWLVSLVTNTLIGKK